MKPLIFLTCLISFLITEDIFAALPLSQNSLRAKITVPYPYSLIRGDVPIYGFACGEDFKEYKLEYGEGENPQEWTLIVKSLKPQSEENSRPEVDFSLDKTIPGNLGVWDTGLSEYEYGEHLAGLPMGTYTLKLTVSSSSGDAKEYRVPVEVGRVVLNAFSSKLESIDAKADLLIQEHSLESAAGIFSLKPLKIKTEGIPDGCKLIGDIYEINPPGEKFTQSAILEIAYDKQKIFNPENLGIFVFNPQLKNWQYLETFCRREESKLETYVNALPEKFAVYAVFESKKIKNGSLQNQEPKLSEALNPVLCSDTFENGFGQWKNKHGEFGAVLELEREQSKGNNRCLKLINKNGGGNFASIVRVEPFNAEIFSLVKFDYKISKDVKINFLVKLNNKWYDIVFTDDEKVYWDINLEKIGKITGVTADGKWHCAEFNLYEMLKDRTDNFIIQEMVMADWDSTGFKKLEFGHNPRGAAYCMDNFMIKSDRYFWQIGYNDNSDKEFSPLARKNIYHTGDLFSAFPARLNKQIKIHFPVKEDSIRHSYRLRLKFLNDISAEDLKQAKVFLNNKFIPQEKYLFYSSAVDILLESLKTGKNVLILKNSSGDRLKFDCVSLFSLQNIPWGINFVNRVTSTEKTSYYFAGLDKSVSCRGELSGQNPEVNLIFGISELKPAYVLKINTGTQESSTVGLNLRKFEILLNGNKLKEFYYSGSAEQISIAVPKEYMKQGVNIIKINCPNSANEIPSLKMEME